MILFGTYDPEKSPRVMVLGEGLEALGHEVVLCISPLGFDSTLRVAMLRKPWLVAFAGVKLAWCWLRIVVRARKLRAADVVIVGWMGQLDVHLARWLFPRSRLVLDHLTSLEETASDRGLSSARVLTLMKRIDTCALETADLICVDTAEHASEVKLPERHKSLEIWVGAEKAWFRAPSSRASGPLRIVFYGLYTPLQGTRVIGEALASLVDEAIEVTMIGSGQEFELARKAAGDSAIAQWIPWMPLDTLRNAVFEHHVCLGIFGTTPKALRVVPNKVFQGAAAGCAIVTSGTVPQQRALGDSALFVPPGDANALAETLRSLSVDPGRTDALRSAAYDRATAYFTPSRIAERLASDLSSAKQAPHS